MKSKPTSHQQKQFFDSALQANLPKSSKNTQVKQFFFDKGSVAKCIFN
jgi:hypothetical protein